MKKIIKKQNIKIMLVPLMIVAIALTLSLSSCITIKLDSLKGSGNVITQAFEVGEFERIDFNGIGRIEITQGDTTSLEVEAEENIVNALRIETTGNKLYMGIKRGYINIIPTRDIVFRLTVEDLDMIELSGAGAVVCDSFETEKLSIDSSGMGSVDMDITSEDLEVSISGAGKVSMAGKVDTQKISISGVGSYSSEDLASRICEIDISGAGKAEVNVTETLDVTMSGVGNVEYTGNPSISQNISGVGGTIKSMD
jgi:hypothetical protein